MHFEDGQSATVHRTPTYDGDGVPTGDNSKHVIADCAFDQLTSAQADDGTITVSTTQRLLCLDVDADVQAADRVQLADGTWWRVTGDPERMRSPFGAGGWSPGCVIPVEATTPLKSTQP